MISFTHFFETIEHLSLGQYKHLFQDALTAEYHPHRHGDYQRWNDALSKLPEVDKALFLASQNTVQIGDTNNLNQQQHQSLLAGLRELMPWRKGPFCFFGHTIDTEWRSDLKWQRLQPHISPLKNRIVLDVGCGSGYHLWRMLGDDARFALGIDPSQKFIFQFAAVKKYHPMAPVFYLPLRSESLPADMECFDTVFSMGVIYHRRSPFDHLDELKAALKPSGELVLETLVVPGDVNTVLCPADRYAQMRNVWQIGSSLATKRWLERSGFEDVRIVDETVTTPREQRKTEWMTFNSLTDFLDPQDHRKTIEGYPAPQRALFIARKAAKRNLY